MAPRATRQAAAKVPVALAALTDEACPSNPLSASSKAKTGTGSKPSITKSKKPKTTTKAKNDASDSQSFTPTCADEASEGSAALARAPTELPHGMGKLFRREVLDENPKHLSSDEPNHDPAAKEINTKVEDTDDAKANLELAILHSADALTNDTPTNTSSPEEKPSDTNDNVEAAVVVEVSQKKKSNGYGVVLGETPYPEWEHPTPQECQKINEILSEAHFIVEMPDTIPLPSLTVAGCGEVPCVLEALVRTRLSAATTRKNAGAATQGINKRYGVLDSGRAKGCVDWNAVRLAGEEELMKAITPGGLQRVKAKDIMGMLNMVYEENNAQREKIRDKALQVSKEGENGKVDVAAKDDLVAEDVKEAALIWKTTEEILAESGDVLTLDYMHAMSLNDAYEKFLTFPGIGVKTAACALLFCMQRPSFAVDTHVFRLCKWLGWVPLTANVNQTFAHCDFRVPNELKYSLHQLLIEHGMKCARCKANTSIGTAEWEKSECVLEDLVKRTGARKGGADPAKRVRKGKATSKEEEDSQEEETVDEDNDGQKVMRFTSRGRKIVKKDENADGGKVDKSENSMQPKKPATRVRKPAKVKEDQNANDAKTKPVQAPKKVTGKRKSSAEETTAEEETIPPTAKRARRSTAKAKNIAKDEVSGKEDAPKVKSKPIKGKKAPVKTNAAAKATPRTASKATPRTASKAAPKTGPKTAQKVAPKAAKPAPKQAKAAPKTKTAPTEEENEPVESIETDGDHDMLPELSDSDGDDETLSELSDCEEPEE